MKELSIKEKAKAYDEALERAKKELDACGSQDCDAARQIFRLFSELKESEDEDEKIRKELIKFVKVNIPNEERYIAWLEKQGGKKPVISDDALREGIAHFGITQYQIDNWLKKYVDVEKQGEQKPAWSDEDKEMLREALAIIDTVEDINKAKDCFLGVKTWLKSLKQRIGE